MSKLRWSRTQRIKFPWASMALAVCSRALATREVDRLRQLYDALAAKSCQNRFPKSMMLRPKISKITAALQEDRAVGRGLTQGLGVRAMP